MLSVIPANAFANFSEQRYRVPSLLFCRNAQSRRDFGSTERALSFGCDENRLPRHHALPRGRRG